MACMKRIVILANSIKFGGRCVAGREIDGSNVGGWVRPVSSAEKEEISLLDQRFEDGSRAKLLDIVEIEMLKAKPHGCQTENHLIDSSGRVPFDVEIEQRLRFLAGVTQATVF
jgi:putative nucleic acid modification protein with dual OB domain